MLPDLALLTIFDFYVDEKDIYAWQSLVHVCRKWRNIVFASPRRLNLRLCCTAKTLERRKLDVWPLLPILVCSNGFQDWGLDYIIAALKHNDRVCGIDLCWISSPQTRQVLAAMQQPFPALKHLKLRPIDYETALPIVPASFLGGSAPSLQTILLDCLPFPGLPNLLLSATHLVKLILWRIPPSGYISPEAMVTGLSVLTKLESLDISFESPPSRSDRRHPPPSTRALLPVLTKLYFAGVHGYLEDFVSRIDTPVLNELQITFLTFDTPQLTPFISRIPKSNAHNEARVLFSDMDVWITLPRIFDGALELAISYEQPDRQLSWMAQLCRSSLPQDLIPMVEHLYIQNGRFKFSLHWDGLDSETEKSQWLELLRPFTSVKCLYIPYAFEDGLVPVLQGLIGERVTEVLPALQTLFFQDSPKNGGIQEVIGPFVAARQLSGHPIGVAHWDGK